MSEGEWRGKGETGGKALGLSLGGKGGRAEGHIGRRMANVWIEVHRRIGGHRRGNGAMMVECGYVTEGRRWNARGQGHGWPSGRAKERMEKERGGEV